MTAKTMPALPERVVSEIQVLSNAANSRGTCVSLREVVDLTSPDSSVDEIEELWASTPALASKYKLQSGLIVPLERSSAKSLEEVIARESRSRESRRLGSRMAAFFRGRHAKLISISGSTSYHSVSANDDLDFFCITRTNETWLFLSRALALARAYRLLHPKTIRTCFSYVIDHDYAEGVFARQRDALFARDALSATVLFGEGYYQDLLHRNDWISQYFPKFYGQRVRSSNRGEDIAATASAGTIFLNHLAYAIVGGYVKLRSYARNLNLQKEGLISERFAARIGRNHCIFESERYRGLRILYHGLKPREANQ